MRQVRFGLVGIGRIAQNQIAPALKRAANASLYAASSRDPGRASSVGATKTHSSYSELFRDPDVEAVFIATHNGLHRNLVIEALRAGKHVLCEKPLALNASECEEILRESESCDRHVLEAFMYRYHPQIERAGELIRDGVIGNVVIVEASFRFHLTRENDVRLKPDFGGGALLDVGCYCVNASRLFLGDEVHEVRALSSFAPSGVDMSTQAVLDFGEGRFAVVSCAFDSGLHQRVSIVGTDGVIHLTRPFVSWTGEPTIVIDSQQRSEVIPFAAIDTYQAEIEDLARAILEGTKPLLGPGEGLANARILDRVAAASRS